jgi:uncharacterized protein YkwD
MGRRAAALVTLLGLLTAGFVGAPAAMADTIVVHPLVAKNVLSLMNQERSAHHLSPLRMNTDLIDSAYHHNLVMAGHDVMAHQLPGEKSFGDRLDAAHYHWSTAGECIGWTSDNTNTGALNIQRYMYGEKAPNDGHRQIILSGAYLDVGVSVITDTTHGKLWITEDFGHLM